MNRNPGTWRGAFDVSPNGLLVYQSGNTARASQLLWLAPGSKAPVRVAENDNYRELALSPDGRRLAVTIGSPHAELWIYDLARGIKSRLTFTDAGFITKAAWAPDAAHVAFSQVGSSGAKLYVKEAGGSGKQEELILPGTVLSELDDWSKDGQYLLFHAAVPPGPFSLYVVPIKGERKPKPFLQTAFLPPLGTHFSPDSKWVAYLSSESGSIEAYVTHFPDASGKWQISVDGAHAVRWFPNGQALLYERTDGTLVKVPFSVHGRNPEIGAAKLYLTAHPRVTTFGEAWDLAADGRVIVNTDIADVTHTINVVINWTSALKR